MAVEMAGAADVNKKKKRQKKRWIDLAIFGKLCYIRYIILCTNRNTKHTKEEIFMRAKFAFDNLNVLLGGVLLLVLAVTAVF